jgi:hypothetical protein
MFGPSFRQRTVSVGFTVCGFEWLRRHRPRHDRSFQIQIIRAKILTLIGRSEIFSEYFPQEVPAPTIPLVITPRFAFAK